MDLRNPRPRLKMKYALFGLFFVWACIAISGYPIWLIAQWLEVALGILEGVPVKEQTNGWLWSFLFIMEAVSIVVVCYGVLAMLFSKVVGWSKESYVNIFWKSKYPIHWLKK